MGNNPAPPTTPESSEYEVTPEGTPRPGDDQPNAPWAAAIVPTALSIPADPAPPVGRAPTRRQGQVTSTEIFSSLLKTNMTSGSNDENQKKENEEIKASSSKKRSRTNAFGHNNGKKDDDVEVIDIEAEDVNSKETKLDRVRNTEFMWLQLNSNVEKCINVLMEAPQGNFIITTAESTGMVLLVHLGDAVKEFLIIKNDAGELQLNDSMFWFSCIYELLVYYMRPDNDLLPASLTIPWEQDEENEDDAPPMKENIVCPQSKRIVPKRIHVQLGEESSFFPMASMTFFEENGYPIFWRVTNDSKFTKPFSISATTIDGVIIGKEIYKNIEPGEQIGEKLETGDAFEDTALESIQVMGEVSEEMTRLHKFNL